MWNVYVCNEDGTKTLVAADCGSQELAWDVVDYMCEVEGFDGCAAVSFEEV